MPGSHSRFIHETGEFRCDYRWAISARKNPLEQWGLGRLHEPSEPINVRWDGFPLDSTFSRGRLDNQGMPEAKTTEKSAYDAKEKFDYKYSNGLAIMPVEVSEEEAIERAQAHITRYHTEIAEQNLDMHINTLTEIDIAGVQLIHLPFWSSKYLYRPNGILRHLKPSKEKRVLIEGYTGGVLAGELAIVQEDKLKINTVVCSILSVLSFFLAILWHQSILFAALFFIVVAFFSAYLSQVRHINMLEAEKGQQTSTANQGSTSMSAIGDEAETSA